MHHRRMSLCGAFRLTHGEPQPQPFQHPSRRHGEIERQRLGHRVVARFLQLARNVMAAVNEAMRTPLAEDMKQSGKVRVGVTYTVAGYFLPPHHARFARTYPRIRLELIELSREAIEKALVDGSLDIAVMLVSNLRNKRNLAHDTLIRSHRRLWLPVEHPFCQHDLRHLL